MASGLHISVVLVGVGHLLAVEVGILVGRVVEWDGEGQDLLDLVGPLF